MAISLAGYFEGASERRGHQRLAIVCRFFLFSFFLFLWRKKVKVKSESFLCTLSIVYHYHMQFLKRPVGESTRKDMFFFYSEIKADKET